MQGNGEVDLTRRVAAPREHGVVRSRVVPLQETLAGRSPRYWGPNVVETTLIVAAVVLFGLGYQIGFAEFSHRALESWHVDGLLLALPLLSLALVLVLRRRATAWQHQHARFRAVVEHAADVVAIVDDAGVVQYVSPALTWLLGEQPAAWVGRQVLPLMHPEDVPRLRRAFARLLLSPGASSTFDCRLRHQDGAWRDVEVIATNRLADAAVAGLVLNVRDMTARKAAEAEVIAALQHEDRILERIVDGYVSLDPDWTFTALNAATERMLGVPRERLLGRNAWEAFAPAVETPIYAEALRAQREGRPVSGEFYFPSRDAWFDVLIDPSPEGISVFFHDVTSRRRLTEELRASEARYRTLVEQVPAVIYTLDADEQATRRYFSPYLTDLTGYTPEEALARPEYWLHWVHPADHDRVAALDAADDRLPFRAEYRHRRKDGSYVWVLDECVPVRNDAGVITSWQGIMLDITPRVEAEEARARLAAIVDSADDAIFSIDHSGVITSWNRGAEQLYGYLAAEAIGQSVAILLPQGDDLASLAGRHAVFSTGDPRLSYTTVRRRRDGSLVDVAVSLSPIRDAAGNVTGYSSITRDITAWKDAEQQLQMALDAARAANATKSQFLAMMSHELRTPLQAILGYTELLLANAAAKLTTEERQDLGYIQQGGQRMLGLVNQLLDLSRIEAGRMEVVRKPVDLPEIVEQVRQDIAPLASQKGLLVRIDLPATLPPVLGDAERLRQILLNLAGNAVKFTQTGSVAIHAAAQGDAVAIRVADTGIGIPPEEIPHIFEAFRQADNNLARRHGGAGLGLAISQRLAGLMKGAITVESTEGEGSVFTLTLPAMPPPCA
ncbi:MAG: PAS domain S-box protein [Thermomicrobiales bacterium]